MRAYRGVLNEKEALETTLKALSVQQEASVTTDLEDSRDRDEAGKDQLTSTDPQDGKDEEAEQEDSHPQEQVKNCDMLTVTCREGSMVDTSLIVTANIRVSSVAELSSDNLY